MASKVIDLVSPITKEKTAAEIAEDYSKIDWIPFFKHEEQFPDFLLSLLELSPTHNACVNSKAKYCLGDGFVIESGQQDSIFSLAKEDKKDIPDNVQAEIKTWARNLNPGGESLADIAHLCFLNKWGVGNYGVELVRGKAGNEPVFYAFAHSAKNIRLGKKNKLGASEYAYLSADFKRTQNDLKRYPPTKISLYPKWEKVDGMERTFIFVKEKSLLREYYGLPSSIASMLWQKLEYRIPSFNLDEFDNGFMPSVIMDIVVPQGTTESEAEKILENIEASFTGDGKGRKLFLRAIDGEEFKTNAQVLDNKKEGNYQALGTDAENAIIKSHGWHPALAGIQTAGKLGNVQELRNALLIAYAQEIKPAQDEVLNRVLNPIFYEYAKHTGKKAWLDTHLAIANSIPVSFFGEINVNDILTEDEKREVVGFAPKPKEEAVPPVIKETEVENG